MGFKRDYTTFSRDAITFLCPVSAVRESNSEPRSPVTLGEWHVIQPITGLSRLAVAIAARREPRPNRVSIVHAGNPSSGCLPPLVEHLGEHLPHDCPRILFLFFEGHFDCRAKSL